MHVTTSHQSTPTVNTTECYGPGAVRYHKCQPRSTWCRHACVAGGTQTPYKSHPQHQAKRPPTTRGKRWVPTDLQPQLQQCIPKPQQQLHDELCNIPAQASMDNQRRRTARPDQRLLPCTRSGPCPTRHVHLIVHTRTCLPPTLLGVHTGNVNLTRLPSEGRDAWMPECEHRAYALDRTS